jgi:hypothetical protein
MTQNIVWPEGKQFAFTVFDDTDLETVANVGRVYTFLADHGLRTTKSCWSTRGDPDRGEYPGQTLEDADYRQWLLDLVSRGFDVDWHGATWHGSRREDIVAGLERYAALFQHYPVLATNHNNVEESMYWGSDRLTGWRRLVYNLLTRYVNHGRYRGHIEGTEFFWGDLCKEHVKYFRNFIFRDVNTLNACPPMPYHDPQKPYVNYWFASSDGANVKRFNACLSEENQDRLEAEGGACIMYTHFANGFDDGNQLNRRFEQIMKRLAKKNGWFVPCRCLLDHLLATKGHCVISDAQRRQLERKWLFEKIFIGTT